MFAAGGHLQVGDAVRVRMADTAPATLRVVAIYDRAAGLGDVILDPAVARRHAAVRPTQRCSSPAARRADGRWRATRRTTPACGRWTAARTSTRCTRRTSTARWGVWLVVGLAAAFATLALINTAAMTTTERRDELATIRLLGGTAGHATRMVALEMVPTIVVALGAGAAIVAVAVAGVPRGLTGFPLVVPLRARRRADGRRRPPRPARRRGDGAPRAARLAGRGDARQRSDSRRDSVRGGPQRAALFALDA